VPVIFTLKEKPFLKQLKQSAFKECKKEHKYVIVEKLRYMVSAPPALKY